MVRDLACILILSGFAAVALAQDQSDAPSNAKCLGCYNINGFAMPAPDGTKRSLHASGESFAESVHGNQACLTVTRTSKRYPTKKC